VALCGAVLEKIDANAVLINETIKINENDLLDYAPVTEAKIGGAMTIGDLCFAAVDMSDNTAANLLMDWLGGPQAVTSFLRRTGDDTSRLDRREPELNSPGPSGEEDTSTPLAMASTFETMLLGNALSPAARVQLMEWMNTGGVTGTLLRASAPNDWEIADKSGSGVATRSLVAMVSPPQDDPYFVAIYLSDAEAGFETRNAALIELSAAVVDVLSER
jgi:beta-lactamase class A